MTDKVFNSEDFKEVVESIRESVQAIKDKNPKPDGINEDMLFTCKGAEIAVTFNDEEIIGIEVYGCNTYLEFGCKTCNIILNGNRNQIISKNVALFRISKDKEGIDRISYATSSTREHSDGTLSQVNKVLPASDIMEQLVEIDDAVISVIYAIKREKPIEEE